MARGGSPDGFLRPMFGLHAAEVRADAFGSDAVGAGALLTMRKSALKKGRSRRLTYRFREIHEDSLLKVVEPHHVFLRKLKAEDIDGEIYKS